MLKLIAVCFWHLHQAIFLMDQNGILLVPEDGKACEFWKSPISLFSQLLLELRRLSVNMWRFT